MWVNVPEKYTPYASVGLEVRLTVASHPGRIFEGTVTWINPVGGCRQPHVPGRGLDPERGSGATSGWLRQGIGHHQARERAHRRADRGHRSLCRRDEAVRRHDGKAKAVTVETGTEGAGWIEVQGDVPVNATVVVSGQTQLADGTEVTIRHPEELPAAEAARAASRARTRAVRYDGRPIILRAVTRMSISDICIRRPVFTWVLVASPVVLGILSYFRLGVDLFPNVDFPVCTVTTTLPGASAEEMETSVTKPIEDVINTVSGVDAIRSVSSEGMSIVTVQFLLSKDGDVGTQEVRDKVSSVLAQLPKGTEKPIVDRFETDAMPIMTIAISGRRNLREITELARKQIKEQLETVSGVGLATIVGGRTRAMNVTVDTDKLVAYKLSIDDVQSAL